MNALARVRPNFVGHPIVNLLVDLLRVQEKSGAPNTKM